MPKSALHGFALLPSLLCALCVSGPASAQAALGRARAATAISIASLSPASLSNGGSPVQDAQRSSPEPSVWDRDFNSQFQKLVTAAADNFLSQVKQGTDGPEVDLDLSVLGNTDTCGYLQGGTIGAPVCIFQFDAGEDEAPAKRKFDALMSHIKTLLPGWKQKGPDLQGETRLTQFTTEKESVKCSLDWSNTSGSYVFNVNFIGHLTPAKLHGSGKRRHSRG
ncbi:MAG: hypothetical protein ACRD10_12725 [Terriglobia bacterium]